MSISSMEFLSFAQDVMKETNLDEFCYRNAGGRAYYAVYHQVKDYLDRTGVQILDIKGVGVHERVIRTIKSLGGDARAIGDLMEKQKKFRSLCDYRLNANVKRGQAISQISDATAIITLLESLHKAS